MRDLPRRLLAVLLGVALTACPWGLATAAFDCMGRIQVVPVCCCEGGDPGDGSPTASTPPCCGTEDAAPAPEEAPSSVVAKTPSLVPPTAVPVPAVAGIETVVAVRFAGGEVPPPRGSPPAFVLDCSFRI